VKIENISLLLLKSQNDGIRLQKTFGSIVVLSWKSSHLVRSQNIMIRLQKGFDTTVMVVMEIFTFCKIAKSYDTTSKRL